MRACQCSQCMQGRVPCPCPDACRLTERDYATIRMRVTRVALLVVGAVLSVRVLAGVL